VARNLCGHGTEQIVYFIYSYSSVFRCFLLPFSSLLKPPNFR